MAENRNQTKMTVFASQIINWYKNHARILPWRFSREEAAQKSYEVWISEVMLQQTRVETVVPYYSRWMERFPSLSVLAQSCQQEVLQVWEGLGYYRRADNLLKTAQIVVQSLQGNLPREKKSLIKLPGIGDYTASAIASIAFGENEYVLDGNVRRVLARVFNVGEVLGSSAAEKTFNQLSWENLPQGLSGDYNQAMMDLGAVICLPKLPQCLICPVSEICYARQNHLQNVYPRRNMKPLQPHYFVAAAVICHGNKVLIARRPPNRLLGGLWEYPGGKLQSGEDFQMALHREVLEELNVQIKIRELMGIYQHAYTHFRITLHAFCCQLIHETQPQPCEHTELAWVSMDRLAHYPMGKVDRQISNHLPYYTPCLC